MNKAITTQLQHILGICLVTLSFFAYGDIELDSNTEFVLLSEKIAVYPQSNDILSFESFVKEKDDLPYTYFTNANYGFNNNGIWLYSSINNLSERTDWVFDIHFPQLDQVQLYLVVNNKLIYQNDGGRQLRSNYYRLPTFDVYLPKNQKIDIYFYVRTQGISTIAPITLQTKRYHLQHTLLDYLGWGIFYGGLLSLALYHLMLFIAARNSTQIIFVCNVLAILSWQIIWSGHVQLLPSHIYHFSMFREVDAILLVIGSTSTLLTAIFLKNAKLFPSVVRWLFLLIMIQLITVILVNLKFFACTSQASVVVIVAMVSILANIVASYAAVKHHFTPAKPLLAAWSVLGLGSLLTILMFVNVLPVNVISTYSFQMALFIQACLFVAGIAKNSRHALEMEVVQASADAENNFLLIEEQNVHLDMARKEALKASDVKSQFLANMSHEVRTPLNAIIGFSKELERKVTHQESIEQVSIISASASDLLVIVNDILDFSKMEAGKLTLNNKPFSPLRLVEDMVALVSKSAHLKQLEFIFTFEPLPSALIGDFYKIKQILNNLLSNALKFTNYGYIHLRAYAEQTEKKNHYILTIVVQDTGIGISDVDRNKLFIAFNQLDDELNRSFQGTGLGLVICQELALLMQGNIKVDSRSSVGSEFTLTIPLEASEPTREPSVMPEWEGKTAYVFDPNPITRLSTSKLLHHIGVITYTYETLDVLTEQAQRCDFLFAALPLKRVLSRFRVTKQLEKIAANISVFLYSGPEPEIYRSESRAGTAVCVKLPLTVTKVQNINKNATNSNKSEIQQQLNALPRARVLAVDDMDTNLKLLKTWLTGSYIELHLANSGESAVQQCQSLAFDLILMDIQMPSMDGIQTTQLVRKTALNSATPIIAITAHAFQEEKQHFLASGMDDYLPKPIDLQKFVQLIHTWCSNLPRPELTQQSISMEDAIARSNQNKSAALAYISDFVSELPEQIESIQQCWSAKDYREMQNIVHRLHGACCYTGVNGLQAACSELEGALKKGERTAISLLVSTLLVEAEKVISEWNRK